MLQLGVEENVHKIHVKLDSQAVVHMIQNPAKKCLWWGLGWMRSNLSPMSSLSLKSRGLGVLLILSLRKDVKCGMRLDFVSDDIPNFVF